MSMSLVSALGFFSSSNETAPGIGDGVAAADSPVVVALPIVTAGEPFAALLGAAIALLLLDVVAVVSIFFFCRNKNIVPPTGPVTLGATHTRKENKKNKNKKEEKRGRKHRKRDEEASKKKPTGRLDTESSTSEDSD